MLCDRNLCPDEATHEIRTMSRIGGEPERTLGRFCYRHAVASLLRAMRVFYKSDTPEQPVGCPTMYEIGAGYFWPAGRAA